MQLCASCGNEQKTFRNSPASVCPPIKLQLSRATQLRRKLRALICCARLPVVVFGEWVLGRDPRTVQRWLAGDKIPHSAALWIDRLQSVELRGGTLTIQLRWSERRPRWRLFQAQKKRTLYRSVNI